MLRFIKFTREIIRISRENSPRLISPPSIIEPSSTNQSAFARKFETFPRIFPSIYSIFPCRGARNDRHRLLIAGFPPLYRGWIDRASSLSSLQDSSSLRVPRCSRIVRGKVRCFSIAEKFFFRGDEGSRIDEWMWITKCLRFFFDEEDLLCKRDLFCKWKNDCFAAFISFIVFLLCVFTKKKFYSQIIYGLCEME